MARCSSCSAELQPAWKFCIYCGERVAPATNASATSGPATSGPDDTATVTRRHVTALGLFGWALGGLLVVLAIAAAVLLNS